ncbi:hypothetical protein TGRUB_245990 [Toxoplasma gondii RUB]|uniref:Uncharacterized protein n=4 Tax=Toxoplasma gondii TaxID=5811 RepID=S7V137_TOXGG|nr:hypothetical protein TGGT1_245990 [Toxoplasma gondii GT1]KAF4638433.1 hypothetical protein TGRH88_060410 [Toxoplasma gondii]KFG64629.1 hypothetical protein TGRUB_245990 [Toxoplasma gondii RUB]RQX71916.1 hypothetical protein TGCAST_245990 [Toxoplasma gondii CAST]
MEAGAATPAPSGFAYAAADSLSASLSAAASHPSSSVSPVSSSLCSNSASANASLHPVFPFSPGSSTPGSVPASAASSLPPSARHSYPPTFSSSMSISSSPPAVPSASPSAASASGVSASRAEGPREVPDHVSAKRLLSCGLSGLSFSPSSPFAEEVREEVPGESLQNSPKRRLTAVSVKERSIEDTSGAAATLTREGRCTEDAGPVRGRIPGCRDTAGPWGVHASEGGAEGGLHLDAKQEANGKAGFLAPSDSSFLSRTPNGLQDGELSTIAARDKHSRKAETSANAGGQGGDSGGREGLPNGSASLSREATAETEERAKEVKKQERLGGGADVDQLEAERQEEEEAGDERNADTGFTPQDFYDFSEDIAALMGAFTAPHIDAIEAEAVAETVRLCLGFLDDAVARGLFVASMLNAGLQSPVLLPRQSASPPGQQEVSPGVSVSGPSSAVVSSPAVEDRRSCKLLAEHCILALCNASQRKYQRCRQVLDAHRQVQSLLTAYDDTLMSSVNPIYPPVPASSTASRLQQDGEADTEACFDASQAARSVAATKGGKGGGDSGKKKKEPAKRSVVPGKSSGSETSLQGSSKEEPSRVCAGGDKAVVRGGEGAEVWVGKQN